jgi:hypothetical protein
MSQMQMFPPMGNVDPSTLNLNNTTNPNPNFNDFNNMNSMGNLGFYPVYPNANGQSPNN